MNFHVGQKVVCIDASSTSAFGTSFELIKRAVYTVRWVGKYYDPPYLCIRLEEIRDRQSAHNAEQLDRPFWAARFRPVVERKASIEVFTAMLTPDKVKRAV